MNECITFPRFASDMNYSNRISAFFNKNSISLTDEFFDANLLTNLYNEDPYDYYLIKLELELKGFLFNDSIYSDDIDYSNYSYLYCDDESVFTAFELNKLSLWSLFSKNEYFKKDFLNYIPLDRFSLNIKFDNEIMSLLDDLGISVIKYKYEDKNNNVLHINEKSNTAYNESTLNITGKKYQPKFIMDFFLSFVNMSNNLIESFSNYSLKTINDFLKLTTAEISDILTNISVHYDYSFNLFYTNLTNFMDRKKEFITYFELNEDELISFNSINQDNYLINELENYFYIIDFDDYDESQIYLNNLGLYSDEMEVLSNFKISNVFQLSDLNYDLSLYDFYIRDNTNNLLIDFASIFNKIFKIELNTRTQYLKKYRLTNILNVLNYNIEKINSYDHNRVKSQNNNYVLRERELGRTLESIAVDLGLTRERVRQIENSSIQRAEIDFELILSTIFKYMNYIPIDVIYKLPGLITFIKRKKNNEYFIDEKIGIVVATYTNNKIVTYYDDWDYTNEDFYKNLLLIKEQFNIDLSYYHKYIYLSSDNNYRPTKLKSVIGDEILLSMGEKGFNINEDLNIAFEYYEKHKIIDMTERAIIALVTSRTNSVLIDLSTYMHTSYVDKKQIDLVCEIVDNLEISYYDVFFRDVYVNYEDKLNSKGINNYIHFYGIASKYYTNQEYEFTGRGMGIRLKNNVDDYNNLVNILKKHGNIINIDKLVDDYGIIETSINNNPDVYRLDSKHVVTKEFFSITPDEKKYIDSIIEKNIFEKRFCHGSDIYEEIVHDVNYNDFIRRNNIDLSISRLIYTLYYYFGEKYNFSHISESITNKDFHLRNYSNLLEIHFKGREFSKLQVQQACDYYKIDSILTLNEFLKSKTYKDSKGIYRLLSDENISEEMAIEVINFVNQNFEKNEYVFVEDIISKLKLNNFDESYYNNRELLYLTIIEYSNNKWIGIRNDVFAHVYNSNAIIYNNSDNVSELLFTDFLIKLIKDKFNNFFITEDEINDYLIGYGFIINRLSSTRMRKIFDEYYENGNYRMV